MAALAIREARAADWPAIWSLMEPIVRAGETYCWDTGTTGEQARQLWLEPAPTVVFVAEKDGVVAGTAQLHPNRSGNGSHVANASFMTAPQFSGQGIARALAEHVLDEAARRGYRSMQFNAVVETNTRAVGLWQSLGFGILATVPEAFRHPTEGFTGLHIMYRTLAAGRSETIGS
ncbi:MULTISPECIES: GNAT family N-acetyltransferase [unclassified Arthrobacter]|uniref:GNAT family N-acetyltransferase n=1 Tax=unclassified Arthrobacter TaxID=235627 RepID=UPI001E627755|nr:MULTISPECIES: GNAT family N-acetyltransferase [unclassified Arthrobacter]MCC9144933.1 GNAT family N-acetyltransferase [Arthrobacter sp. zg-Y919]MDK1276161.1 GNAT family N-acetyltransferase [Arthrobacter sp. zg.Y919]WIB02498.1 GNAT family N-acetyltransferase [Arthrobacter sp. zg-Y919]